MREQEWDLKCATRAGHKVFCLKICDAASRREADMHLTASTQNLIKMTGFGPATRNYFYTSQIRSNEISFISLKKALFSKLHLRTKRDKEKKRPQAFPPIFVDSWSIRYEFFTLGIAFPKRSFQDKFSSTSNTRVFTLQKWIFSLSLDLLFSMKSNYF